MRVSDAADIEAVLGAHHHFQECPLRDLRLIKHGLSLELVFEYIWTDARPLVADASESSRIVTVVLDSLHELHLTGGIPAGLLANPEEVDWGFSEVALVELKPVSDADAVGSKSHRLSIVWESERRIDVVFSALEVA